MRQKLPQHSPMQRKTMSSPDTLLVVKALFCSVFFDRVLLPLQCVCRTCKILYAMKMVVDMSRLVFFQSGFNSPHTAHCTMVDGIHAKDIHLPEGLEAGGNQGKMETGVGVPSLATSISVQGCSKSPWLPEQKSGADSAESPGFRNPGIPSFRAKPKFRRKAPVSAEIPASSNPDHCPAHNPAQAHSNREYCPPFAGKNSIRTPKLPHSVTTKHACWSVGRSMGCTSWFICTAV